MPIFNSQIYGITAQECGNRRWACPACTSKGFKLIQIGSSYFFNHATFIIQYYKFVMQSNGFIKGDQESCAVHLPNEKHL